MKNLFKYAFALVASALMMSACTDEYEYDVPAAYEGAYITSDAASYTFTPADEQQTFSVKVVRPQGGPAKTIRIQSDNELFEVPSSVTFEEGQTEAEITVTADLAPGQTETLHITLPEGTYDLNYFGGTFTVTVNCEFIWEEAGKAIFYDYAFTGAENLVDVEHAVGTNLYVLKAPFRQGYDIQFYLDDDYNALTLPASQQTGFVHSTYGAVEMVYNPQEAGFFNDGYEFAMYVRFNVSIGSFGLAWFYFDWIEGYPGE
ncbi:MAG: hypothetical protein IJ786_00490 [Bacteroidaceae bacterium]|nr:hypothetical protein [Bacteroidaceae bacterium]